MNSLTLLQRCGTVASVSFALIGCDGIQDPADKLKGCLASTEQTVLLRQLALSGKAKDDFEYCRKLQSEDQCRALYLNANGAVRQCMRNTGYIFSDMDFYQSHDENPFKVGNVQTGGELKDDVCTWQRYLDPTCYHNELQFKLTHWWAFRRPTYEH
jgi:hypothetical protein